VQGEGRAASSALAARIGRTRAGVLAPNTGPAPLPHDGMKEELSRTRANVKHLEDECERAKAEAHYWIRTCVELDHENKRQKDTIQNFQQELSNMGLELQEYKTLSDNRGKELISHRVFMTKADFLSVLDLKDMANTLNDEIFQASASLGHSLIHHKHGLTPEEMEAAYAGVCRTASEPLARILVRETKKPEPEFINPLLVEVVLEMILVHFCSAKIESWFPGAKETSDFLTAIYSEIRRTG